jgi:hypothetical protein
VGGELPARPVADRSTHGVQMRRWRVPSAPDTMNSFDSPLVVFAAALAAQWLATYAGDLVRMKVRPLGAEDRDDFDVVRTASLTLLGLIIAFTFSMAVTRYDQRKNYEEEEANAIGTEYLRIDFLPAQDAATLRELMSNYLDDRVAYYRDSDERDVGHVDQDTAKLQTELWAIVARNAANQPTQIMALVVSGMNDVLNTQGYTQAAWWNRIPLGAWALMMLTAISCNLLLGYGERRTSGLAMVLPIIVAISFFLIADIDNPRAGFIRVPPYNLLTLQHSLHVSG